MTREEERAIEWDCQQAVTRFYHYLDNRRYEDLANLFTPDGVWHRQGKKLEGRAAIMAALEMRPASLIIRHAVSNVVVDISDENTAEANAYITISAHNTKGEPLDGPAPYTGPGAMIIYTDHLVRADDGWKVILKTGDRVFAR